MTGYDIFCYTIFGVVAVIVLVVLFSSLDMARKWDVISEEEYERYWGKEDEHRQVPRGSIEDKL
jgi:hypothetical protein